MERWSVGKAKPVEPNVNNILLIITPLLYQPIYPSLCHSILNDSALFILAALRAGRRPAPMEVIMTTSQDWIKLQTGMEN